MSCCPCFPSKKKYAKKLKEEGVKNNNKKKYKQKKGGKNVEMPAIVVRLSYHWWYIIGSIIISIKVMRLHSTGYLFITTNDDCCNNW